MRVAIGVVVGLVLLVLVATQLLLGNLDDIVRGVIEDVGTEVTGTAVRVDGVSIDLASGSGEVRGLTIANPRGYSSANAFNLEKVSLGIDLASLSAPVVVIREVTVKGAKLVAEQKGERTNLSDLQANIERHGSGGQKDADKDSAGEGANTRLMVEKFVFAGTSATLVSEARGEQNISLPDVRRQNIGDKNMGLTPEQLAEEILGAVVDEVEAAVVNHLADLAKEAVKDKVRDKLGLGERG